MKCPIATYMTKQRYSVWLWLCAVLCHERALGRLIFTGKIIQVRFRSRDVLTCRWNRVAQKSVCAAGCFGMPTVHNTQTVLYPSAAQCYASCVLTVWMVCCCCCCSAVIACITRYWRMLSTVCALQSTISASRFSSPRTYTLNDGSIRLVWRDTIQHRRHFFAVPSVLSSVSWFLLVADDGNDFSITAATAANYIGHHFQNHFIQVNFSRV